MDNYNFEQDGIIYDYSKKESNLKYEHFYSNHTDLSHQKDIQETAFESDATIYDFEKTKPDKKYEYFKRDRGESASVIDFFNDIAPSKPQKKEQDDPLLYVNFTKLSNRKLTDIIKAFMGFIVVDNILHVYETQYGRYVALDKATSNLLIRRQSPESIQSVLNTAKINEIVWFLKASEDWENFDGSTIKALNGEYINFLNGTLKIPELTFHKHNPKFYCTTFLNVEYNGYDSNYRSSLFYKVVEEVLGDEDRIDLLQKEYGIFIAALQLKQFYYWYGLPNTGKTVLCDIIKFIIGAPFTSALEWIKFDKQFGIGNLYGKMLNIAPESSKVTTLCMEVTKKITGRDYTSGELKYIDVFDFYPYVNLLFTSNHKLSVTDGEADEGFLDRMNVLEFNNAIPKEKQDFDLKEKLKTPAEIKAIISFALDGVIKLYEDNFQLPKLVDSFDYFSINIPRGINNNREFLLGNFRQYLFENYEINSKNKAEYIPVPTIFNKFKKSMRITEDFEYRDTLAFHNILQNEFNLEKVRRKPNGEWLYAYSGLKLK